MAALLLLIFDQISKLLAVRFLSGTDGVTLIPGVFQLYYLENTGAAFGMMKNGQLFFILIALLILALVCYFLFRLPMQKHYHPLRAACVLIMAGAAGNMFDRIFNGYVVDFLYFSLINFPVFNFADCFVCVGVALALILFFTVYRKDDFSFLSLHAQE